MRHCGGCVGRSLPGSGGGWRPGGCRALCRSQDSPRRPPGVSAVSTALGKPGFLSMTHPPWLALRTYRYTARRLVISFGVRSDPSLPPPSAQRPPGCVPGSGPGVGRPEFKSGPRGCSLVSSPHAFPPGAAAATCERDSGGSRRWADGVQRQRERVRGGRSASCDVPSRRPRALICPALPGARGRGRPREATGPGPVEQTSPSGKMEFAGKRGSLFLCV